MKNGIPSIVFWDICGHLWDMGKRSKNRQNVESSPVKQAKTSRAKESGKLKSGSLALRGGGLSD